MRLVASILIASALATSCGAAQSNAPRNADIQRLAREAFLSQTFNNSRGARNRRACASHFEVLGVEVLDRQSGQFNGISYATVVVRLQVRARTAFPYDFSCSWSTRSNTGRTGQWRAGETRSLTRSLDFTRWESGWRIAN